MRGIMIQVLGYKDKQGTLCTPQKTPRLSRLAFLGSFTAVDPFENLMKPEELEKYACAYIPKTFK